MRGLRIIEGRSRVQSELLRRRPLPAPPLAPAQRRAMSDVYGRELTPAEFVAEVFDEVRGGGLAAAERITRALGLPWPERVRLGPDAIEAARSELPRQTRDDLQVAAKRVRAFYEATMPDPDPVGVGGCWQRFHPVKVAGIYAPGGRAVYPSSLLMTAIPARVAGVAEIVVASPPGPSGEVSQVVLAAAAVAGVDAVYALGGAQAIAAMALGAGTLPRADVLAGPGNIFVVLALRHAFGAAGVPSLPGPTETLIVADRSADPAHVAADLLAQAEHDPMASPLLLTDSAELAAAVGAELDEQLGDLPRADIARAALARNGGIGLLGDLSEAADLVDAYAPEHLCLLGDRAAELADSITGAAGIFVGDWSPEVLGDYVAGPSHVMPVGGTARFSSPVSVYDFLKRVNRFEMSRQQARPLFPVAARLARLEGLEGHARAAERR